MCKDLTLENHHRNLNLLEKKQYLSYNKIKVFQTFMKNKCKAKQVFINHDLELYCHKMYASRSDRIMVATVVMELFIVMAKRMSLM